LGGKKQLHPIASRTHQSYKIIPAGISIGWMHLQRNPALADTVQNRVKMNDEILQAALDWLLQEKSRLDLQIAEIKSLLNRAPSSGQRQPAQGGGRRRHMSAEARKRISDAQKKRWSLAKKRKGR
jgi:hypothetical protein